MSRFYWASNSFLVPNKPLGNVSRPKWIGNTCSIARGARNAMTDAILCTSSIASLFSPGEVGDCTKHWQCMSERPGTISKQPFQRPAIRGKGKDWSFWCALISWHCVWKHHHWTVIFSQPSVSAVTSPMLEMLWWRVHCFDMSHKTAPLRAPVLCRDISSTIIRQPSTVFIRQPGLQPAIDPEFYLSLIVLNDVMIQHQILKKLCVFK